MLNNYNQNIFQLFETRNPCRDFGHPFEYQKR